MNVRKMSEAAMLSAAVCIVSILAIGTGVGYTLYIDTIVPIIYALIILKCDFKYTLLSAITTISLIMIIFGNVVTAVWMTQSLIIGLAVGMFINKKESILDDLFYTSIIASFVMILIDVYLSGFLGYSFMVDCKNTLDLFSEFMEVPVLSDMMYYILVASIPFGTMIITYFPAIILGKKFKLLNSFGESKFIVIKNLKKYINLITLSKKTMNFGIFCIVAVEIIHYFMGKINIIYVETVLNTILYISLFFVIKECYGKINRLVFSITRSKEIFFISEFAILYFLVKKFKIAAVFLIVSNYFIDKYLSIMENKKGFVN